MTHKNGNEDNKTYQIPKLWNKLENQLKRNPFCMTAPLE